jgi:hypothetical protein
MQRTTCIELPLFKIFPVLITEVSHNASAQIDSPAHNSNSCRINNLIRHHHNQIIVNKRHSIKVPPQAPRSPSSIPNPSPNARRAEIVPSYRHIGITLPRTLSDDSRRRVLNKWVQDASWISAGFLILYVVLIQTPWFMVCPVHLWCPLILDIPSHYPIYLSMVTIFKNEAAYLAEWLEYHLLVGFQKFWLFNNDSTDNATEVLMPYIALGIVNLTLQPGMNQQHVVYRFAAAALRHISYWVSCLDVDEFVVPLETHSVIEVLRGLEGSPGISLNWVMYGWNEKEKKEDGLVLERFPAHGPWDMCENRHTKIIFNPRMIESIGLHEHHYLYHLRSKNPLGKWNVQDMFDRPPVLKVLRLNHYWTKSAEEFYYKRLRGWASGMNSKTVAGHLQYLKQHLHSIPTAVKNDTVIDWAIPLVKENLAKRFGQFLRESAKVQSVI